MSDKENQEPTESTPAEVDVEVQVIPATGTDPEPAEGAEATPAPVTEPDPEPAEGGEATPAPRAEPGPASPV